MKIVVSVDMEGLTGVCRPEQVQGGEAGEFQSRKIPEGIELMIGDVNATVAGLAKAGVDDIIVWDAHFRSFNAPLARLHPAARYLFGGSPNGLRFQYLDRKTDGLILLGYHAKAGTLHAVMEHTMSSSSWFKLKVNGRETGEVGYDAALAGALGVPVIMVSGDDKLCAEAREFLGPDVVAVCVKQGHARHAATCLPPEKTAPMLASAAAEAVRRVGKLKPFDFGSPVTVELVFKHTELADQADLRLHDGRRIDGYTVAWKAKDFATWAGQTSQKRQDSPRRTRRKDVLVNR